MRISFDIIISSDFVRATETATIIAEKTGHRVEFEPLFRELTRPSVIRGKYHTDPEAAKIIAFIADNFSDGTKHSDEENFFDLKARAQKALSYLEERKENNLLVVTHGTFSHMLIGAMAFGKTLTPEEFLALDYFLHSTNTGITTCVFKEGKWRLYTWNDCAHLG